MHCPKCPIVPGDPVENDPSRLRIASEDISSSSSKRVRVLDNEVRDVIPSVALHLSAAAAASKRKPILYAILLLAFPVLLVVGGAGFILVLSKMNSSSEGVERSVRAPTDAEQHSISKGKLGLVAPSVAGHVEGIWGNSWSGTAIPWRLSRDGLLVLVTNAHVANPDHESGVQLQVSFASGKSLPVKAVAIAVGIDRDLAILTVEAATLQQGVDYELLTPQALDAPDTLEPGDEVVAVGSPRGFPQTRTFGRISAIRQQIYQTGSNDVKWIQVDATILPGNSGGPLLRLIDGRWHWIGVVTSRGVEGIGFAIHSGEVYESRYRWIQGVEPQY